VSLKYLPTSFVRTFIAQGEETTPKTAVAEERRGRVWVTAEANALAQVMTRPKLVPLRTG